MHAPVSKRPSAAQRRAVIRPVSNHPESDRDKHKNGRPLACQSVAFEDPSPLSSLQRNPQVQSEGSVCGGSDLG